MATKLTRDQRREEQFKQMRIEAFKDLRIEVRAFAMARILSTKDAFSDALQHDTDDTKKTLCNILFEAEEVATKRETLRKECAYLAERMTDEAKRLARGREADDVTRNSSFTNMAADIAVFNYRLREVSRRAQSARLIIAELFPHRSYEQLLDVKAKSNTLLERMDDNGPVEVTEEELGECRSIFTQIQRELY